MLSQVLSLGLLAASAAAAALPAASNSIPGKFIVRLKPDVESHLEAHTEWVSHIHARNLARRGSSDTETAGIEKTYSFADFEGYAGFFDEETLEAIRANPDVESVEEDQLFTVLDVVEQEDPTWGLSALSNANPPSADGSYWYDESAGEGTFIYIFDSGILLNHQDFGGRAVAGFTSGAASDLSHGTIVGSLAGGTKHGVAKKATVIDVKVMATDSGSTADILAGLTWAVNDVVSKGRVGKAVFNMSLGSYGTPGGSLGQACESAIRAGITIVVAAGNSNADSAEFTPANTPAVITVAASNSNYRRWFASNWGATADLFAPGEQVTGASSAGTTIDRTNSGTSLAAPYVAGVVAYLFALEGPRTPAQTWERLQELAIRDLITDTKGVPNLLLYNGSGQ